MQHSADAHDQPVIPSDSPDIEAEVFDPMDGFDDGEPVERDQPIPDGPDPIDATAVTDDDAS